MVMDLIFSAKRLMINIQTTSIAQGCGGSTATLHLRNPFADQVNGLGVDRTAAKFRHRDLRRRFLHTIQKNRASWLARKYIVGPIATATPDRDRRFAYTKTSIIAVVGDEIQR
jgi:hypothetical protein